jgi:aminotransferase
VSRARWARRIGYMNDLVYVCAPSPLQYGVALGLSQLDGLFYQNLSFEYEKKRDRMCSVLEQAGLRPYIPQGAYYILADVSFLPGGNSKEKAMFLLEQTGVASVPGEAFFHNGAGNNLVRFCFAKTDEELEEACRRLERFSRWERNVTSQLAF